MSKKTNTKTATKAKAKSAPKGKPEADATAEVPAEELIAEDSIEEDDVDLDVGELEVDVIAAVDDVDSAVMRPRWSPRGTPVPLSTSSRPKSSRCSPRTRSPK
jgi:hypothetical protein